VSSRTILAGVAGASGRNQSTRVFSAATDRPRFRRRPRRSGGRSFRHDVRPRVARPRTRARRPRPRARGRACRGGRSRAAGPPTTRPQRQVPGASGGGLGAGVQDVGDERRHSAPIEGRGVACVGAPGQETADAGAVRLDCRRALALRAKVELPRPEQCAEVRTGHSDISTESAVRHKKKASDPPSSRSEALILICLSPGSRAVPATARGGAASTSSSTRSGGSARG
jgi:hypothetical protein